MDWLIAWLGDEFGDIILEPIGDFFRNLFESLIRFLFGWLLT
jgi:hypothetical protein